MKIFGLKNKKTGEIIYSRTVHDFHWDSTEMIAVDGGFDYLRYMYKNGAEFDRVTFELPNVTKQDLYNDWNNQIDNYGWLSEEKANEQNIVINYEHAQH